MRSTTLRLSVIALIAIDLCACLPSDPTLDASIADSGVSLIDAGVEPTRPDASVVLDAGEPSAPDATVLFDAGTTTPTEPDAGQPIDAGSVSCTDAMASCEDGGCSGLADLVVSFPDPEHAVSFRNMAVGDDDCELYEGCVGGKGARSLIEIRFNLGNVGDAAIDLGRPFEDPLFYPSFCQDSYVIDGFFAVELRDEAGQVVAQGKLSTSCIAGAGGGYTCRAQGLGAGDSVEQPIGRCDFLDVTGAAAGNYTLTVTANPDRVVAESNFGNNNAQASIYYAACPGTVCGGTCCPAGVACENGVCMLPDLRINEASAAQSLFITHQTFDENSCELEEMCVSGSGRRRLLEFEGRIENWGPGDLNPGPEHDNPLFEYSACHEHYHFRDFTDYRLLNQDGSVAAQGHKQSFCLLSMEQVEGAPTPGPIGVHPPPGETGCNLLEAGWADIYGVGTPCQWVDITDVPVGDYVLELAVNPLGRVAETTIDNNVVQIPVHVAEDVPCNGESEICGDDIDQDCDDQPDEWDEDCQVCFPDDPFCTHSTPVSGNDSCAEIYEMTDQSTYEAWIETDNTNDVALTCGGEGGDLFFGFTLDSEQIVYLGTLDSEIDTVLGLFRTDCDGEALRCQDDACGQSGSQFAIRLGAGHYLAVVSAKQAGDSGRVRLKYQHADGAGVILLDGPGVYGGDTRNADDSVDACAYANPGDEDGGVSMPGSGTGGSSMGSAGASAGGASGPVSATDGGSVPVSASGKDDIYALAKCQSTLVASTCGTAAFDSVLEVRSGSIGGPALSCSESYNFCASDPDGAVLVDFAGPPGLAFVVVDGRTADAAGEYQMSLIY